MPSKSSFKALLAVAGLLAGASSVQAIPIDSGGLLGTEFSVQGGAVYVFIRAGGA